MMAAFQRALFLDRDGVINHKMPEGDYVKTWQEFEFLPGVLEAIRILHGAGIPMIVISNQRGVSLGLIRSADLDEIHSRMRDAIETAGGALTAILHCPHDYGCCSCRKPDIGMFTQACAEFPGLDLSRSVTVGDAFPDIAAAFRAGTGSMFVTTRPDADEILAQAKAEGIVIDEVVGSLLEGVPSLLRMFGVS